MKCSEMKMNMKKIMKVMRNRDMEKKIMRKWKIKWIEKKMKRRTNDMSNRGTETEMMMKMKRRMKFVRKGGSYRKITRIKRSRNKKKNRRMEF